MSNNSRPRAFKARALGIALILMGVGVAVTALLGPLVGDLIRYHASQGAINQVMGGDVAALFLVAPVSVLAGVLALRRHRAAAVLALGPSVFALYTYTQLALGGDLNRYPGNSERFFLLFLSLFILGGAIVFSAWSSIDPEAIPPTSRSADKWLGWFFIFVSFFLVAGLHLPGLSDAWSATPTASDYLADPAVFWLVKFMDLGIVVPGMVTIAFGILRGATWARTAKYAAVGWMALLGSSVFGMAVVMRANGDPAATMVNTVAFGAFAAIGLTVAIGLYRKLFAQPSEAQPYQLPQPSGQLAQRD